MKTFYIRSITSTHVYTYIKENCKVILDIKDKMSVVEEKKGIRTHDLCGSAAVLYQLSYDDPYVGSRPI